MSDQKTCPFCLADVPVKAIKCRHCESMLDDVSKDEFEKAKSTASAEKPESRRSAPAQNKAYYQAASDKSSSRRFPFVLVIVLAALLLIGAGAGYWFFYHDSEAPVAEQVDSSALRSTLVGPHSWSGNSPAGEIYFQFLPNEIVNIAVVPEEYWFRVQFRLGEEEDRNYLEIYNSNLEDWDKVFYINYHSADEITMTDITAGIDFELSKITNQEWKEVIDGLDRGLVN